MTPWMLPAHFVVKYIRMISVVRSGLCAPFALTGTTNIVMQKMDGARNKSVPSF